MGIKNKSLENMLWLFRASVSAVAGEKVSDEQEKAFRYLYEEIIKLSPERDGLWDVFLAATTTPPEGIRV